MNHLNFDSHLRRKTIDDVLSYSNRSHRSRETSGHIDSGSSSSSSEDYVYMRQNALKMAKQTEWKD